MPGTSQGAKRAALTNKERDPDHYQKIGHAGGSARVAKGFSMADKEFREQMGAIGGKSPRKSNKKKVKTENLEETPEST